MKTQTQALTFRKHSIVMLNDEELNDINGGSILISFLLGVAEGIAKEINDDDPNEQN